MTELKRTKKLLSEQIRRVVLVTSVAALIIASVVFLLLETYLSRQTVLNRVALMSEVMSEHVTAALTFRDKSTATKFLSSFAKDVDFQYAALLDEQGALFVQYPAADNSDAQSKHWGLDKGSSENEFQFQINRLLYQQPITLDGNRVGLLLVSVSLNSFWLQIATYLIFLALLILMIGWGLKLVSERVKRSISEPIETLLVKMAEIRAQGDYSVRIDLKRADEIGEIIRQFNDMVAGIERRDAELIDKKNEIEQHAFFDPLTGLPNRRLLTEQLEHEVSSARRKHGYGAVFYIDLDNFKTINDSLGHDTGDSLLQVIADRIRDNLRKSDLCSRIGGDEFIVVLPDIGTDVQDSTDNSLNIAEQLRDSITKSIKVGGRRLHSSVSIGISLFNHETESAQEAFKQADMAMYAAKKSGRNAVHFFSEEMQQQAIRRLNLEEDLRLALNDPFKHFELYYQGQVNQIGALVGAEALIRWRHPSGQLIEPAAFIPVSEITGLILPIGYWVIEAACKQLLQWQEQNINLSLSVNVSPKQFLQDGFAEFVESRLRDYQIEPSALELEITESLILDDKTKAVQVMKRLRGLGVRFSIDDFGTGYSSLQYLTILPISKLKIDQSFVHDITTDANDAAVVKTIILMTKNLGMQVIAEGVENEDEHAFLLEHGCDLFQGYLFSEPMAIAEFEQHFSKEELPLKQRTSTARF